MSTLLRTATLCLWLAGLACAGSSSSEQPTPESGGKVRIENRSSLNMDIYVRKAFSSPIRIGYVPASETADIPLPRAIVAGSSSFRLEARPARGAGSREVSEPFSAGTGQQVFWSIPPQ
ncbi:MAG TPA: hypothetical protein VH680_17355 [Gemmatimonadales bacterium]|jgi:hypothetical protein